MDLALIIYIFLFPIIQLLCTTYVQYAFCVALTSTTLVRYIPQTDIILLNFRAGGPVESIE